MIGAAGPADVEAITRLEEVTLGSEAWSRSLVEDGVSGRVPTVHYLVAREDGEVVGYAVLSVAGDVAELQRIAVAPGRRRTGIATALLDAAIHSGGEAVRVLLEVREDNAAALGFYLARGFTELDRRPRYYRGGATAVVMERRPVL